MTKHLARKRISFKIKYTLALLMILLTVPNKTTKDRPRLTNQVERRTEAARMVESQMKKYLRST